MLENHISLMHGIKNPDLSQMAKAKAPERDTAEVTDTFSLKNKCTLRVAVHLGCYVKLQPCGSQALSSLRQISFPSSQLHPVCFSLAVSGSEMKAQLSCSSTRATYLTFFKIFLNMWPCVFLAFFSVYFVTRSNLGLLLPLFSPAALFMSLVHYSSFSLVFSAS